MISVLEWKYEEMGSKSQGENDTESIKKECQITKIRRLL